ncbi:MAG: hypothetical protein QM690_19975 [Sphingobium sp.]
MPQRSSLEALSTPLQSHVDWQSVIERAGPRACLGSLDTNGFPSYNGTVGRLRFAAAHLVGCRVGISQLRGPIGIARRLLGCHGLRCDT